MPPDTWLWRAHYRDGSFLDEYDETGQSRGFAQIDQSRCVALELRSQQIGIPDAVLSIPADARPIFFRRRSGDIAIGTNEPIPGSIRTNTVIGFQKTIHGRNVKCLTVFMHDGSVLVTDDDGAF